MEKIAVVAIICMLVGCGSPRPSQEITQCPPDLKPVQNFDSAKFLGKWVVTRGFRLGINDAIDMQFSATDDKNRMILTLSYHYEHSLLMQYAISFADPKIGQFGTNVNVTIVATDYTSYAVLIICAKLNPAPAIYVLTRAACPSEATLAQVYKVVADIGVQKDQLRSYVDNGQHDDACTEQSPKK